MIFLVLGADGLGTPALVAVRRFLHSWGDVCTGGKDSENIRALRRPFPQREQHYVQELVSESDVQVTDRALHTSASSGQPSMGPFRWLRTPNFQNSRYFGILAADKSFQ